MKNLFNTLLVATIGAGTLSSAEAQERTSIVFEDIAFTYPETGLVNHVIVICPQASETGQTEVVMSFKNLDDMEAHMDKFSATMPQTEQDQHAPMAAIGFIGQNGEMELVTSFTRYSALYEQLKNRTDGLAGTEVTHNIIRRAHNDAMNACFALS